MGRRMRSTPKPRGRGRGRGRGGQALVVAVPAATGGGDSQPPGHVAYGGNGLLFQYPQTPTPLPVRAQRQIRRSEAGFRPRIVELDPDTDRTLQPTPAPSAVARRSSVQSRISVISSVPSFSPGGVITSTRLESPALTGRRSSAGGQFVRPRTPQKRGSAGGPQPAAQASGSSGAVQTGTGASPAGDWQTPVTRRSAPSSAASSASSAAASSPGVRSAQTTKISAKPNQSQSRSENRSTVSSTARSQSRAASSSATRSQSRSAGRGGRRGQPQKTPPGPSGRGRGRGRGAAAATAFRSRSPIRRQAEDSDLSGEEEEEKRSEEEEVAAEEERSEEAEAAAEEEHSEEEVAAEEEHSEGEAEAEEEDVEEAEAGSGDEHGSDEEVDFDDSNDHTFRPSAEHRRRSSLRFARPSDSTMSRAGPSNSGPSGRAPPSDAERSQRGRPSNAERSQRGRPSDAERSQRGRPSNAERSQRGRPSNVAADSGLQKSTRQSRDVTASRLSRRSDHPALSESRPAAGRGRGRGRGRSASRQSRGAALRCPMTVQVAGRSRTIAADNRDDMLETVEDLVSAARSRPLKHYADIDRFTWDLDQCVIDLMALQKAGRQGATKFLREVKKVRTAAEALLQPQKVELVTLYNEAFKADKKQRQDEAIRAFLFETTDSDSEQ